MLYSNPPSYSERVAELVDPTLACFREIAKKYFLFHCAFVALVILEALFVGLFFSFLIDSFFLGVAIALIFFTTLVYFILRLYYNEQKPQELGALRDEFLAACRSFLPDPHMPEEECEAISSSALRVVDTLEGFETQFYALPENLKFAEDLMSKWIGNVHFPDVQKMKELFMMASIAEHIKLIQLNPTDGKAHANLADLFIALAGIYKTAERHSRRQVNFWRQQEKYSLERATLELKIASHFAPEDMQIHEALAKSYHALGMASKEIHEYELLTRLRPRDPELLFTLGRLYFESAENAKGLRVYQELKKDAPEYAQKLIGLYGAYLENL
jgi:tetratricopeptide (TPR) repeat protein